MIDLQINDYQTDPSLYTNAYPFCVSTIGRTANDNIHRLGGINDCQLLYAAKGNGIAIIDGAEVSLTEKSIFFLPPNTPHEYYSEGTWETWWITYSVNGLGNILGEKAFVCEWKGEHDFESLYMKIWDAKTSVNLKECSISLYKLLLDLKEFSDDVIMQKRQARNKILPALKYINEHYCDDIDLNKLSDMLGITQSHFCRIFKSFTGVKPIEYITKMRIAKAKMIIINKPEQSISDIGQAVGYRSESYFIKQFRKYEKITPSVFRNKNIPMNYHN